MEVTTISIDRKTLEKLSVIAVKASMTKTELVTAYVDALFKLIEEARPPSQKISLTTFDIDLLHGTLKQSFANLYDITELPDFIQNFYSCQKFIEDGEAKTRFYTKEELLKEGFNGADIDILLDEQKRRFKK
ncbi:MAG: hypothetical protein ABSB89_01020 [Candidatus Bathyarchaeia archaeon]